MSDTTKIELSAEDVMNLICERAIHKNGFCFSSNSSFLSIMSLIASEMNKEAINDRSDLT